MSKKFSYDNAISELNEIIKAIQNEEVSLDKLAEMISRANELINLCKSRLREIDQQVEKLTDKNQE